MGFSHGKDSVFKIADAAGVGSADNDISAYLTSVGLPRSAETAEVSTLGSSSKSYIAGLKDGTISLEGKFDPTLDAIMDGILGLDGVAFEYTPQVAGPVYTGVGILTSYEVTGDIGDAVGWTAELQISGAVGRA